ncbi:SDR family NAD(P)-dependent oxidoreductase [Falsibacillus albus]|uniref:SDR family oxidoreductase n=1 Tax=Falsibacillus albus TaxID=2478915 RepID=A0A3L7K2G0_9BACI|nr:SDR family oxidoreductase [Falsibacillus albus]RLQ96564.1 SDR family oxidoreductase [Falsibacillus albus]
MQKETVLITGASNGIGLEMAEIFSQKGHTVVLAARSKEKMEEIKHDLEKKYNNTILVKGMDLSVQGAPQDLYEELKRENIQIDILINNAGFGLFGDFTDTDLDKELNMIQLNVSALTAMSKLFSKDMVQRGKGKILNVASTAAFQPGPLMAVYYATKAYVLSFSEALENELSGTGVHVSTLCPGPTETGFSDKAELGQSKLFTSGVMDAKKVAAQAVDGLMNSKSIIIPGIKNKLLAAGIRFLPRKTVTATVRKVQERK